MKPFGGILERKCLVFPVVEIELPSKISRKALLNKIDWVFTCRSPLETQRKICIFIYNEVQFPILRECSVFPII